MSKGAETYEPLTTDLVTDLLIVSNKSHRHLKGVLTCRANLQAS